MWPSAGRRVGPISVRSSNACFAAAASRPSASRKWRIITSSSTASRRLRGSRAGRRGGLQERLSAAGHRAARVRRHAQLASAARRYAARDARRRASGAPSVSSQRRTTPIRAVSSIARTSRGAAELRAEPAPTWTSPTSAAGSIIRCSSTRMRAHVRAALARLPAPLQRRARLVFTAHSIPQSMAERSRYRRAAARVIAARGGGSGHHATGRSCIQSRSGRPEDPWLEPDVCDYLRTRARARDSRRPSSARLASCATTSRCCTTSITRQRRVRGDRPADGPSRSGQRRSAVRRHDGRRRASHDSPLRSGTAVADPAHRRPDVRSRSCYRGTSCPRIHTIEPSSCDEASFTRVRTLGLVLRPWHVRCVGIPASLTIGPQRVRSLVVFLLVGVGPALPCAGADRVPAVVPRGGASADGRRGALRRGAGGDARSCA